MDKRHVKLSSLFKLTFSKSPFSRLGIVFTLLAVFVILPIMIVVTGSIQEPYQKYNFDAIKQHGTAVQALITDVDALTNVSINGENPRVISYSYTLNGSDKRDKFQTMEIDEASRLNVGDKITVKEYEGESAIQDMEPFSFPVALFFILPTIFFTIGAVFTMIGLIPALKDFNLYKNGIVKEATILSMVPNPGMPVSGVGKSITVYYDYIGRGGNKIFGESRVHDFSILSTHKTGGTIKIFASEDESRSCVIPTVEIVRNNWKV